MHRHNWYAPRHEHLRVINDFILIHIAPSLAADFGLSAVLHPSNTNTALVPMPVSLWLSNVKNSTSPSVVQISDLERMKTFLPDLPVSQGM
jgi:hypothetical protein